MIKYKKLREQGRAPQKGSEFSAGFDLYAVLDDVAQIKPGQCLKIGTGIALEIPKGYFGAVFARSGLATKEGLRPANCVGVVDSDYRGEVIVPLYNDSDKIRIINKGDRVAQIIFLPCLDETFVEADTLEESDRGSGGFGSTGVSSDSIPGQMTIFDYMAAHRKGAEGKDNKGV